MPRHPQPRPSPVLSLIPESCFERQEGIFWKANSTNLTVKREDKMTTDDKDESLDDAFCLFQKADFLGPPWGCLHSFHVPLGLQPETTMDASSRSSRLPLAHLPSSSQLGSKPGVGYGMQALNVPGTCTKQCDPTGSRNSMFMRNNICRFYLQYSPVTVTLGIWRMKWSNHRKR